MSIRNDPFAVQDVIVQKDVPILHEGFCLSRRGAGVLNMTFHHHGVNSKQSNQNRPTNEIVLPAYSCHGLFLQFVPAGPF
jgi:hypothetical protein